MTAQVETQQNNNVDKTTNDKELNFRKQEAMFQRMLAEKEARIAELEKERQHARQHNPDDDDDDNEPYVDRKKLKKTLDRFGQQTRQETQTEIQKAVQLALEEERRQSWVKQNPDFNEVMKHAQKLADTDPELADAILQMPDTFERQKLVYRNIKLAGLHQEKKQPSIQETIDKNKRSPYYQPTGISNAPYAGGGDFSSSGQKNAYEKMQELKKSLRI